MLHTYHNLSELYGGKKLYYTATTYKDFATRYNPVTPAFTKGEYSTACGDIDSFYTYYVWLLHNAPAYCTSLRHIARSSSKRNKQRLESMPDCTIDIVYDSDIICSVTIHKGICSIMMNDDNSRSGARVRLMPFELLQEDIHICKDCGCCIEGCIPYVSCECFGTIETPLGTFTKVEFITRIVNAFYHPERMPILADGTKGTKSASGSKRVVHSPCKRVVFVRAHYVHPKKGKAYLRREHYRGFPDKIKRTAF